MNDQLHIHRVRSQTFLGGARPQATVRGRVWEGDLPLPCSAKAKLCHVRCILALLRYVEQQNSFSSQSNKPFDPSCVGAFAGKSDLLSARLQQNNLKYARVLISKWGAYAPPCSIHPAYWPVQYKPAKISLINGQIHLISPPPHVQVH